MLVDHDDEDYIIDHEEWAVAVVPTLNPSDDTQHAKVEEALRERDRRQALMDARLVKHLTKNTVVEEEE